MVAPVFQVAPVVSGEAQQKKNEVPDNCPACSAGYVSSFGHMIVFIWMLYKREAGLLSINLDLLVSMVTELIGTLFCLAQSPELSEALNMTRDHNALNTEGLCCSMSSCSKHSFCLYRTFIECRSFDVDKADRGEVKVQNYRAS